MGDGYLTGFGIPSHFSAQKKLTRIICQPCSNILMIIHFNTVTVLLKIDFIIIVALCRQRYQMLARIITSLCLFVVFKLLIFILLYLYSLQANHLQ